MMNKNMMECKYYKSINKYLTEYNFMNKKIKSDSNYLKSFEEKN